MIRIVLGFLYWAHGNVMPRFKTVLIQIDRKAAYAGLRIALISFALPLIS